MEQELSQIQLLVAILWNPPIITSQLKNQVARLYCSLTIFLFVISCKPEYKKCEIQTTDIYLKAYNDILNEIIVQRSYSAYLGADEEQIFEMCQNDMDDSDKINEKIVRLHNKMFKDTSRFCTIYIDTLLRPAFSPWSYFQNDTNVFRTKIRDLIKEFSDNCQATIDSLNSIQIKYLPSDFTICTANVKSLKNLKTDHPICHIGKISFSKLVLSKAKDRGLLYYEFRCGDLCGYGALVAIKKINNDWYIENDIMTWIS